MNKLASCIITASVVLSMVQCQDSHGTRITDKNECFQEVLAKLAKETSYTLVLKQLNDSFPMLQKDRVFTNPTILENKVDDAVFFNADRSKGLLLVLQKPSSPDFFAKIRVIKAERDGSQWKFSIDRQYSFGKEYFSTYPQNTFDNISKLGRHAVLTDGNPKSENCDIDENYWFADES
jgi:hypothetical protein